MTRYCPEYYSPDEVYTTEAQSEAGVVYGPNGNDFTGTLSAGSAPTTPGTLIGQLIALDEQGAIEQGAEVTIQIISGPGDAGIAYDSKPWTVTSDSDGLCEFDGVIPGAKYRRWRGVRCTPVEFTAPLEADDDRFNIDEVIGEDE